MAFSHSHFIARSISSSHSSLLVGLLSLYLPKRFAFLIEPSLRACSKLLDRYHFDRPRIRSINIATTGTWLPTCLGELASQLHVLKATSLILHQVIMAAAEIAGQFKCFDWCFWPFLLMARNKRWPCECRAGAERIYQGEAYCEESYSIVILKHLWHLPIRIFHWSKYLMFQFQFLIASNRLHQILFDKVAWFHSSHIVISREVNHGQ